VDLTKRRQKLRLVYAQEKTAACKPIGRRKLSAKFGNESTKMNSSLVNADRITHLRIVVVALVAAILVAAVGTFAARNENEKAANFHGGEMAVKQHKL
jgi:hypothetical protein